jgi:hypothetical protein
VPAGDANFQQQVRPVLSLKPQVSAIYLNSLSASRCHHLLKTFWGWSDQQLPDATVIWTSPSGQTYVTTPGCALLFPGLCAPTAALDPIPHRPRCAERAAMMPQRRHSRAQNHARYIAAQRRHNRQARQAAQRREEARIIANDEPPPF